jgi:hypothetical protein
LLGKILSSRWRGIKINQSFERKTHQDFYEKDGSKIYFKIYREAIAVFSSAGRGAKRKTQLNAKAFSWRLRISASVCG